jgi:hypothetical protein
MDGFRLHGPKLLLTLAWALLAPVLKADPVVPPPAQVSIGKKDGTRIKGVYLNFNYAELSAAFALDDGVSTVVVPCSELDPASLAIIAAKIPPVVGWLDADKVHVCVRVIGALTPQAETAASDAIWQAGETASSVKEKIAWFQLFGMISELLKAEQGFNNAVAEHENLVKTLDEKRKVAEDWCRKYGTNPLTGEDRSKAYMEWAIGDLIKSVAAGPLTILGKKKDLMIRLASFRAYIGYCEISGRAAYAKELGELLQKILTRSATAREVEAPGCALMGMIVPRVVDHSHSGNNAKLLKQVFGKMTLTSNPDKALELLIPNSTVVERDAVKTALLNTVSRKITQATVGNADAQRYFWYEIKPAIADFDRRQGVLRNISFFLEEAVRMGSL